MLRYYDNYHNKTQNYVRGNFSEGKFSDWVIGKDSSDMMPQESKSESSDQASHA